MAKKQPQKRKRLTLLEDIEHTATQDQHETINLSVSIVRMLYLHALHAMRDGPYVSFSAYVSDLIRKDLHGHTTNHLTQIVTTGPEPEKPKLGFEKQGEHVMG